MSRKAGRELVAKKAKREVDDLRRRAAIPAAKKKNDNPERISPSQMKQKCVHAGVVDRRTGKYFSSTNEDGPPEKMHPIIEKRIDAVNNARDAGKPGHPSEPGEHAEVHALNKALLARNPEGKNLTEADLHEFTMQPTWLTGNPESPTGRAPGALAPRCDNCSKITRGADNTSGDAPPWTQTPEGGWVPPPLAPSTQ